MSRAAALPPPIPAAAKRRPSLPPPIPPRGSTQNIPASTDDGSIEIDIDEAPAPVARIIARGTVPPANWPIEDFDGPTPLPPPYVEIDDDWLDPDRIVHALDAGDRKIERTANVRQPLPRMLIAKLAIAAVSVGALSAMAAILLSESPAGSRAPTVQPAPAIAATKQPERGTVTPIETGEASATPAEPKTEARPQAAIASTTPRVSARPSTGADPHTGTLMVSSKPPCEIVIDGVATVLTTPQRAIKLRTGTHKVTLYNDDYKINSTFEVVVEAGKATKLIRDLMPRE
jgi:hypothetical protein